MKGKVEDPLNGLEKGIKRLEEDIQRSGKIMSNMQNSIEKLKFQPGHKPIPPVKSQEDVTLVRRPEMQGGDVDDGCVFSGTASGKSANVKVRSRICFSFGTLCDCWAPKWHCLFIWTSRFSWQASTCTHNFLYTCNFLFSIACPMDKALQL